MKSAYFLQAATAFGILCSPLCGQAPPTPGILYQQAGVIGTPFVAGGAVTTLPAVVGSELFSAGTVQGSPFSATHESHSLQVLGDGTRIERNESYPVYRDSMGRTRVENGPEGARTVVIQDPVAGKMIILNPATHTAQELPSLPAKKLAAISGARPARTAIVTEAGQFERKLEAVTGGAAAGGTIHVMVAPDGPVAGVATAGPGTPVAAIPKSVIAASAITTAVAPVPSDSSGEDLPAQSVNGVMATGHKTTITIPVGQIGNDRPIQVVNETWYSSDLQMVVKSSNSDPRFGNTSYELTNIVRSEPDPSLFEVPSDYTVSDPKAQFRVVQPKE